MQKDEPFVDVWPAWPLTSAIDVKDLLRALQNEFKVFCPKFVSFWLSPQRLLELQEAVGAVKFGQVVAGARGKSILARPLGGGKHAGGQDIAVNTQIQPISSMDFYEYYAASYEKFHRESPFLRHKVPTTSREDLARAVQQGLAFHLIVDGCEAGLIAGERRRYLGLPGIYMLEMFLYEGVRGRRLAPLMQRRFIERAIQGNMESSPLIWGTIDVDNQPSLRTALGLGRGILSREVFLPFQ